MNINVYGAAAVMRTGDKILSSSTFHRATPDETLGLATLMEKITQDALATGKWIRNPNGSLNWILPAVGSGEVARNVNLEATDLRSKMIESLPMVKEVFVQHADGSSDHYTLTEAEFTAFQSSGTLDTKQNVDTKLKASVSWVPETKAAPVTQKSFSLGMVALGLAAVYLAMKH